MKSFFVASLSLMLFFVIACREATDKKKDLQILDSSSGETRSGPTLSATTTSNGLPAPEFTPTPTPVVLSSTLERRLLEKMEFELHTNDLFSFREQVIQQMIDAKDFASKKKLAENFFEAFEYQIANDPEYLKENSNFNFLETYKQNSLVELSKVLEIFVDRGMEITSFSTDEKMLNIYALTSALETVRHNGNLSMFSIIKDASTMTNNSRNLHQLFLQAKPIFSYVLKIRFNFLPAYVLEQASGGIENRMLYFYWTPVFFKKSKMTFLEVDTLTSLLIKTNETKAVLAGMNDKVELDRKISKFFKNIWRGSSDSYQEIHLTGDQNLDRSISQFFKYLDIVLQ